MIARVQSELRAAMLHGDRTRVDALRLMLSALQRAEVYREAGHADRAAKEEADIPVIDEFLPKAMDEAELETLVDAAIAETGATSMKEMGRVMGLVTQRAGGHVDGRAASALVRARLGGAG